EWTVTVSAAYNRTAGVVTSDKLIQDASVRYVGDSTDGWGVHWDTTQFATYTNATNTNQSGTLSIGDTMQCAVDMDAGKIWFGHNNTWLNGGDPAAGTSEDYSGLTGTVVPAATLHSSDAPRYQYNFADADLVYTPPTGFSSLTTDNLPAMTASNKNVNSHFKTVTWAGNSTSGRAIDTGMDDCHFGWIKARNNAYQHSLADACRGNGAVLHTHVTDAEVTSYGTYGGAAFNGTGLPTLEDGTVAGSWINDTGTNYVGWFANLPNTKTSGWSGSPTITPSKEIYNTDLGMSIVTYTGNGTAGATIPHSLGVKPGVIIVKRISAVGSWYVYHSDVGATKYMLLESTIAAATNILTWNDTEPTDQLISLGSGATNSSGQDFVAYIFAPSDFIKIGSYSGNSSADGSFVNMGIKTEFMLTKCTGAGTSWPIFDAGRYPNNPHSGTLFADTAAAENADVDVDLVATGTKCRRSSTNFNASGSTYVYLAIGQPTGASNADESPGR
ncbi:SPRY domain-containing protein, partial [candidate division KSB1 bacterium]